jgi:hypothetical protein
MPVTTVHSPASSRIVPLPDLQAALQNKVVLSTSTLCGGTGMLNATTPLWIVVAARRGISPG